MHRKTVTIVFCDMTGSTALGESLDPEALRVLLERYFEEMRGIVERHGGTVEKFIGDAVMAVFGVPLVREDDAIRAVRAAGEMQASLPELGIEGRIGVNTGEVIESGDGTLVIGDAVNVAARLQQAAAPGEILIGAGTRALVAGADVEVVGPLELKGKAVRVPAFRLLGLGPAPERTEPAFVGRRAELELVRRAWERTEAGRSVELLTVVGEAGVGKSRLVRVALTSIDARVVRGRCLPYGEGITYWPVVEVLRQLALRPADDAVASAIGSLLGDVPSVSSAEEIAWAFRKLLEQAAAARPLVVVFDDIHWGEETFLDLIEHVALLATGAPILLLCVARPELLERRPGWPAPFRLEPLASEHVEELIPRRIEGALRRRIAAAAGGNPLFIGEMLAMADEATGEIIVPPTLRALLGARLDQLDPTERRLLERGAIEGEIFHRAAVQALAPEEASVTRRLAALVRIGLIRPDRAQLAGHDGFRFTHLLIRDAAYDALPKASRAELHERFAGWLETNGAGLVELDEILGYHLEQAFRYRVELGTSAGAEALAARAAGLLIDASRTARLRGDHPAAATLLGRALDLDSADRLALMPELSDLLLRSGRLAQATAVLDEALESARDLGDERTEAVASIRRALLGGHIGDEHSNMDRAIEIAARAADVLERLGEGGGLAIALLIGAQHLIWAGQAGRAATMLERAQTLALAAGDLPTARECFAEAVLAADWGPTPMSEADALVERVPAELRLSRLVGGRTLHRHGALADAYAGRFEEARRHCAEAQQIAAESGNLIRVASGSQLRGLVELLADDPEAAERELREGYDRLGELGETGYRATTGALLADALARQGRDDEAWRILETVEALSEPDDADPQVRLRAARAVILARQGAHREAELVAQEAVELAARTDLPVLRADALLALAEVCAAGGDSAGAVAALRRALELFEHKENVVQVARTRERLRALDGV